RPGRFASFVARHVRELFTKVSRELLQSANQPPVIVSVAVRKMRFMTSTSDTSAEAEAATSATSRPSISLASVVLDTDDPPRLAEFYTTLLGWQVEETEDDWITIGGDSGAKIAFQLALNHKPPTWPDNAVPQQFHLDLRVDNLDAAATYAESIGAQRAASGDHSPNWIVFLDPSGHPFCLCA
ncbi:MAG TPA: VOC family protein, partial [Propionibacteriaceae bacterium]|nr:VOC family protein [Propionibacteriaceae bacterium]